LAELSNHLLIVSSVLSSSVLVSLILTLGLPRPTDSHLKWLKGAVQDFETNMAEGLKSIPPSVTASDTLGLPSLSNNDLPPPAPTTSEGPKIPNPTAAKASITPVPEPAVEEKLVYMKRKEDQIQDLQLSHLGEATPGKNWVPWVQSQFSKSESDRPAFGESEWRC
jgi:hypothetical protein